MGVATVALALGLGACTQTTYGTGTPVGMQTIQDLAGMAELGSPKQESIKYAARPGLVPPPSGTPLPPPESDKQAVAAANWPNDPDAQAKRFKEDAAALEKFCADDTNKLRPECRDPGFRLPQSADANASRQPSPTLVKQGISAAEAAHSNPQQDAEAMRLFAESKGQVAVDENGKPIRRYLTDPPSDYRIPDPEAPVVFDNKAAQKKFRWPWEKAPPAADNLTPSTTTASGKTASGGT